MAPEDRSTGRPPAFRLPLERADLLRLLPYGDDFLFVDRVTELSDDRAVGFYCVPHEAPWIRAHFRHLHLMPATLIAEALAQIGTLLVRRRRQADQSPIEVVAMSVERLRFYEPVLPGNELELRVELGGHNRRAARLEGEARVAQRRVCKGRMMVATVDSEAFRERVSGASRSSR